MPAITSKRAEPHRYDIFYNGQPCGTLRLRQDSDPEWAKSVLTITHGETEASFESDQGSLTPYKDMLEYGSPEMIVRVCRALPVGCKPTIAEMTRLLREITIASRS